MFKLLKFLKKSVFALVFVAILLMIQAATDLSLPTYTSEIVNVGIMKSGIASSVPEVIRKTELDKVAFFMDETEKATVLPHFVLLSKANYTDGEWSDYLDKYPLLATDELYIWDGTEEETISNAISIPIMLVFSLEGTSESSLQMKEQLLANIPADMQEGDSDIFSILSKIPAEGQSKMFSAMRDPLKKMPETMLTSTAATYMKAEYTAIGLNIEHMQVSYIIVVGIKMLLLALLGMFASILVTFFAARIAARMGRDLRSNVFRKVLSFSHKEMDQFSTASLITRSTNDIQQVQMLIVMLIRIVI